MVSGTGTGGCDVAGVAGEESYETTKARLVDGRAIKEESDGGFQQVAGGK